MLNLDDDDIYKLVAAQQFSAASNELMKEFIKKHGIIYGDAGSLQDPQPKGTDEPNQGATEAEV